MEDMGGRKEWPPYLQVVTQRRVRSAFVGSVEVTIDMRVNKRGYTLKELLVVIAIIATLAAILFPVFAMVKAQARMTSCSSNFRQMGSATLMYAQDYDETMPLVATDFALTAPPNWSSSVRPRNRHRNGRPNATVARIVRCSQVTQSSRRRRGRVPAARARSHDR